MTHPETKDVEMKVTQNVWNPHIKAFEPMPLEEYAEYVSATNVAAQACTPTTPERAFHLRGVRASITAAGVANWLELWEGDPAAGGTQIYALYIAQNALLSIDPVTSHVFEDLYIRLTNALGGGTACPVTLEGFMEIQKSRVSTLS
ncbi:MAG: hypothetical protein M0R66_03925 [Candidatus Omnitrophica bacterium]|nr:hypothetical protein [Candidatus Omnitrophota bacterium]